jgi:TPR repeat protein
VTLRRAFLARSLAGVLLVSLSACSSPRRKAPPSGDAGAVAVQNQLRPCGDLPTCEDACRHGSSADCLSAANNYSTGDGVPEDEVRAAALFEAGCVEGSGAGCNLAGRMHEFARGVPRDFTRALSFYEQACGLEYMGGCYNVAVFLENGRGVARDGARAAALYRKVCAAGSQSACAAAARLEPLR